MALGRISTYATFNNTLTNVNRVQADLYDLNDQISSGLKTRNFEGLTGEVEHFTQLEANIDKAKTFEQNNELNISRLRTTDTIMSQIVNVADDIENLIVLRRDGVLEDNIAFPEQMRAKLDALVGELNGTFGGRFLFGGTRTNVPPIITEPAVPDPVTLGTPDANYYQGSDEDTPLRADEDVLITGNVRADDAAFQKLFGGIALALEGHTTDDDQLMQDALNMVQDGQSDLNEIQAVVNTNILTITDINERHENLRLYWTGVKEELANTNILDASTQVAVDQTVLQASFQAFAATNQLRLIDFL